MGKERYFFLLIVLAFLIFPSISAKLTTGEVSGGGDTINNYNNNTYVNQTVNASNYSILSYWVNISDRPTTLSFFSNNLNIGNWTADKPGYSTISYVDEQNASQTNWVNSVFAKISDLVSYVGNWTADKANYFTKTEYYSNATSTFLKIENWNSTNISYATTTYVNEQNTSQTNYIANNNNSVNNYILYVNSTNGAGGGSSSGTSFTQYNLTRVNVTTSSNTAYTNLYTIPLTANKNIQIECNIMQWANGATVGIQYTFNFTGTNGSDIVVEYYTSTTAQALATREDTTGTTNGLILSPTTSAGTIQSPTRVNAWAMTNATGSFIVHFRSETATLTGIMKGSFCRTIEQ